jgi:hypothetical protein
MLTPYHTSLKEDLSTDATFDPINSRETFLLMTGRLDRSADIYLEHIVLPDVNKRGIWRVFMTNKGRVWRIATMEMDEEGLCPISWSSILATTTIPGILASPTIPSILATPTVPVILATKTKTYTEMATPNVPVILATKTKTYSVMATTAVPGILATTTITGILNITTITGTMGTPQQFLVTSTSPGRMSTPGNTEQETFF